jgi:alpha 1,2-mannosyltransferase
VGLYFSTQDEAGFTISLYEYEATIPTLWTAVKGGVLILVPRSVIYREQNLQMPTLTCWPREMLCPSSQMMVGRLTIGVTVRNSPHSIRCADRRHLKVWSNFEIGDLDFWRGEAYSKFFEFLDEKGGFYYEVGAPLADGSGLSLPLSVGVMPHCTV